MEMVVEWWLDPKDLISNYEDEGLYLAYDGENMYKWIGRQKPLIRKLLIQV